MSFFFKDTYPEALKAVKKLEYQLYAFSTDRDSSVERQFRKENDIHESEKSIDDELAGAMFEMGKGSSREKLNPREKQFEQLSPVRRCASPSSSSSSSSGVQDVKEKKKKRNSKATRRGGGRKVSSDESQDEKLEKSLENISLDSSNSEHTRVSRNRTKPTASKTRREFAKSSLSGTRDSSVSRKRKISSSSDSGSSEDCTLSSGRKVPDDQSSKNAKGKHVVKKIHQTVKTSDRNDMNESVQRPENAPRSLSSDGRNANIRMDKPRRSLSADSPARNSTSGLKESSRLNEHKEIGNGKKNCITILFSRIILNFQSYIPESNSRVTNTGGRHLCLGFHPPLLFSNIDGIITLEVIFSVFLISASFKEFMMKMHNSLAMKIDRLRGAQMNTDGRIQELKDLLLKTPQQQIDADEDFSMTTLPSYQ